MSGGCCCLSFSSLVVALIAHLRFPWRSLGAEGSDSSVEESFLLGVLAVRVVPYFFAALSVS